MALLQELRTIGRMYVTGKLSQKDALAHALTTYDRAQEGKRGYNPNALNIYLERLDEFCDGQNENRRCFL